MTRTSAKQPGIHEINIRFINITQVDLGTKETMSIATQNLCFKMKDFKILQLLLLVLSISLHYDAVHNVLC